MRAFTFTLSKTGRYQPLGYSILLVSLLAMTGCAKGGDDKAIKNQEVKSAEKEVPMSAAPAKTKDNPIAVSDDKPTKADLPIANSVTEGTVIESPAPREIANNEKTGKGKNKKASAVGETAMAGQEAADNSDMDKISENDEVIDDSPASPDAPQAKEGREKPVVKNEPLHKK